MEEQVLRANQFELIDERGKLRAVLGLIGGEPVLTLLGKDGAPGLSLSLGGLPGFGDSASRDTCPSLRMYDKDLVSRCSINVYPDGDASLSLCDRRGTPRIMLSIDKDDSPAVSLHNASGMPVFVIPPEVP